MGQWIEQQTKQVMGDGLSNGRGDGRIPILLDELPASRLDSIRIPLCAHTLEGVLMEMNISQAVYSPHGMKELDKRHIIILG